eukprot:GFKZ01003969.1.p1 GENE.GFKZ01003969.1~~GFKZ01003969.1.p1  ORF type:complete len:133 (+),score=14.00 GFKZ01003969.1:587-985(+)
MFTIFDGMLSDPDPGATVPKTNKPKVNNPGLPNPSRSSPYGDELPLSSLEAAPITHTPEGVYGQTLTGRAGEVIASMEMATSLALTGPYRTIHLWGPLTWMDWSDLNSADGDGVVDAVDQAEELDLAEAVVQ